MGCLYRRIMISLAYMALFSSNDMVLNKVLSEKGGCYDKEKQRANRVSL